MSPYFRNLLKSIGHDYMAPDARVYNTKQYLDGGRVGFVKGGVSIENQPPNLEKQKIYKQKVDRSAQLLRAGKTRAQVMRDIVREFKLTREDKYAGTAPWLREAANEVESKGYKITSGVLEKQTPGGADVEGTKRRRALDRNRSNVGLQSKISGLKNSGFHLSHAGFKNSPVGLHNLMYLEGRLNIDMRRPFEDPLFAEMEKFHTVYDNPEIPDQLKRQAAVKYAKNDRALRQKFPQYAKLKTRLSFKNVPGDTSAFTVSEKLPDPSMAISTDKNMLLKGESPKSPKGMEIIKKANVSLASVFKKAGFKSDGKPDNPRSYLSDINKQTALAKQGKSGAINKFNNAGKIAKKSKGLFLKSTGIGILAEAGFEGAFVLNDVLSGVPVKEAFQKSLFGLIPGVGSSKDAEVSKMKRIVGNDPRSGQYVKDLTNIENLESVYKDYLRKDEDVVDAYTQDERFIAEKKLTDLLEAFDAKSYERTKFGTPESQAFQRKKEVEDVNQLKRAMEIDPYLFDRTVQRTASDSSRTESKQIGRRKTKDKLSEIADYGGVANMANGGIVGILKK